MTEKQYYKFVAPDKNRKSFTKGKIYTFHKFDENISGGKNTHYCYDDNNVKRARGFPLSSVFWEKAEPQERYFLRTGYTSDKFIQGKIYVCRGDIDNGKRWWTRDESGGISWPKITYDSYWAEVKSDDASRYRILRYNCTTNMYFTSGEVYVFERRADAWITTDDIGEQAYLPHFPDLYWDELTSTHREVPSMKYPETHILQIPHFPSIKDAILVDGIDADTLSKDDILGIIVKLRNDRKDLHKLNKEIGGSKYLEKQISAADTKLEKLIELLDKPEK